jgi:hypothetical protein
MKARNAYMVSRDKARVIHILHGGLPLCLFSREWPRDWPHGHIWVSLAEAAQATCVGCLSKLKAPDLDRPPSGS